MFALPIFFILKRIEDDGLIYGIDPWIAFILEKLPIDS
jgi:hypothetical protein